MRARAYVLMVVVFLGGTARTAHALFDVSGKFLYENRVYNETTFTGVDRLPVRFADIEVRDRTAGGDVFMASGSTDANGFFSINNIASSGVQDIEIRCMASNRNIFPSVGAIEVRDGSDTPEDFATANLWTSAVWDSGHAQNADIRFENSPAVIPMAPGVPDSSMGPAGAFNIFDQGIRGVDEVFSLTGGTYPDGAYFLWEPGVTGGNSGFFGMTTERNGVIVITGANSRRDEFDDSVILHEYGHFIERLFWGGTRNPGGTHAANGFNDPRLALSEGWATFFSSVVRGEPFYLDYEALGGTAAFNIESDVDYNQFAYSSANELAVAMSLWDIGDTPEDLGDCIALGFDEIWDVFDNYLGSTASQDTVPKVMNRFRTGWLVQGHPNLDGVDRILNAHMMEFVETPQRVLKEDFGGMVLIPGGAGLTRPITFSDSMTISNIPSISLPQQSYAVAAYVEITHPAQQSETVTVNNDLQLYLTSPSGTTITLYDRGVGSAGAENFTRGGANGGIYSWFGFATGATVHPWLDAPTPTDFNNFAGENTRGTWYLRMVDANPTNGLTGHFRRWKLAIIPSDWYDIPPSHGTDVYHENSLYEWLGDRASHEWGTNDPLDTDGNANHVPFDADSLDDGITFFPPYLPEDTVRVDVKLCTSGAAHSRYESQSVQGAQDLYVRGWFDWDNDGFQDPVDRVVDFQTSPLNWTACATCTTASFAVMVMDTMTWSGYARFRVAYGSPPGPTGDEEFGEVEDYEVGTGTPSGVPIARRLRNRLYQNYPNPCNPTTTIRFSTRERGRVQIIIYDVAGREVRRLVDAVQNPVVDRTVVWDGTNNRGEAVASGVYFYALRAPGYTAARKLVVLK